MPLDVRSNDQSWAEYRDRKIFIGVSHNQRQDMQHQSGDILNISHESRPFVEKSAQQGFKLTLSYKYSKVRNEWLSGFNLA